MNAFTQYNFPAKVRKFAIQKASLKVFIAKYEGIVPWSNGIKNEADLTAYIAQQLLPALYSRCSLLGDIHKEKTYFVKANHVDLENHYRTSLEQEANEVALLREMEKKQGTAAALAELCRQINQKKSDAFQLWIKLMSKHFQDDPAFVFLMLQPIFQTTPFGSRRILSEPSLSILQWLHLQLEKESIYPGFNLAKLYFIKEAFGISEIKRNGWQMIPRGRKNSRMLCAAARGSGWCVASYSMAQFYLERFSFYILWSDSKPKAALRVSNKTVYEYVGVNNSFPEEWMHDISLFCSEMDLNYTPETSISFENKDINWWKNRIRYWPLAYNHMPEEIKMHFGQINRVVLYSLVTFFPTSEIEKKVNIKFEFEDYSEIITLYPELYTSNIQWAGSIEETEALKVAWVQSWIGKLTHQAFTLAEIKAIPEEVKKTKAFTECIGQLFESHIYRKLIRIPKSFDERSYPLKMDDLLPYEEHEPIGQTISRAAMVLIQNQTTEFGERIFPEYLRNRSDFNEIRKQAWAKAIEARPSLRLALPQDLASLKIFAFNQVPYPPLKAKDYCRKLEEKPWMLDSKTGGIPSAFKQQEIALKAYLTGWDAIIRKNPHRLWVQFGRHGNRTYLPVAALRNKQILDAFFYGFKTAMAKQTDPWKSVTPNTRSKPEIALAFLMAIHNSDKPLLKKKYFVENSEVLGHLPNGEIKDIIKKTIKTGAHFFFQAFMENKLQLSEPFSDFPIGLRQANPAQVKKNS